MKSPSRRAERVVVTVSGRADAAVCLAAHLMTERAIVRLLPRARGVAVELRPRDGKTAGLAEEFKLALASQRRRWAQAKASLPERAAVLSRALELSARAGSDGRRGAPSLPAEKQRELAAAAAAPVDDPLGIRAPWDTLP